MKISKNLEVEKICQLIQQNLIAKYVQGLKVCKTIQDLSIHSKQLFSEIAALVLPKQRIEYVKEDMPQEIEENKEVQTSETKTALLIQKLRRAIQMRTSYFDKDLLVLNEKLEQFQTLKDQMLKFSTVQQSLDHPLQAVSEEIKKVEGEKETVIKTESTVMVSIEKYFLEQINRIQFRLTNPYSKITKKQECYFPAPEALSFQNHLVAILDAKEKDFEFNFVLSDGSKSQLKPKHEQIQVPLTPADVPVKKIVIWYNGETMFGFQLFAKDETKLYETSQNHFVNKNFQVTILEDNERIVGIRGRQYIGYAAYHDFQFVIGVEV